MTRVQPDEPATIPLPPTGPVAAANRDRMLEYADHPHEHFTDPGHVTGGRYLAPSEPGFFPIL